MGKEMGKDGEERIEEREGGLMSELDKLEKYLKDNGYKYDRIKEKNSCFWENHNRWIFLAETK